MQMPPNRFSKRGVQRTAQRIDPMVPRLQIRNRACKATACIPDGTSWAISLYSKLIAGLRPPGWALRVDTEH